MDMDLTRENEPVLNLMLAEARAVRRREAIAEDAAHARAAAAVRDRRAIGVTRVRIDADEF